MVNEEIRKDEDRKIEYLLTGNTPREFECPNCRERSKREDSNFMEFGTSTGISFITSKGIKEMEPGKSYDQNLDEI